MASVAMVAKLNDGDCGTWPHRGCSHLPSLEPAKAKYTGPACCVSKESDLDIYVGPLHTGSGNKAMSNEG